MTKRKSPPEVPASVPRPAGMQAMGLAVYEQIRQLVQELAGSSRRVGQH